MSPRARTVAVLLLAAMLVVPTPAAAVTRGSPDISLVLSDDRVSPGEDTTLTVTVVNTGEADLVENQFPNERSLVTTARGTTLRMSAGDAPIDVKTGPVAAGSVSTSAPESAQFDVSVDEDAEPGSYQVPVEVKYTYTDEIADGNANRVQSTETVTETQHVTIRVTESAQFEIVSTETDAPVGGTGDVTVSVRNTGDAAASDATFTLQSSTSDLTFGGSPSAETYAGRWGAGEVRTFTFAARVGPDADRRPFSVPGTVAYEDNDGIPAQESLSIGVTPAPEQTFTTRTVETTASTGDTGRLTVALTNEGDRTLTDATVTLSSSNTALTFGGSPSATSFVGEWAPGETREVTVEAAFSGAAEERPYVVEAAVDYKDTDGTSARSSPVTVGVMPAAEQSFDLAKTNATLRVGAEGALSGSLVNEGPQAIENAVLVLESAGSSISTPETEFAVGDLVPGESVAFEYQVEVSSEARDGPRQFTYRLRYDDADGDTRQSDPLYARHDVGQKRAVFDVESNVSVQAGSSTTMELKMTNTGEEELTDVTAKLFADAPIAVEDDEAFVDSVPPGETRTLVFSISAAGSATPKDYPVSLDFQYTEPDGDTKLSDTYQVPVRVTQSGGGGLLSTFPGGLGGLGVAAAVLLVGGVAFAVRGRL
jgi:hypothetical protein